MIILSIWSVLWGIVQILGGIFILYILVKIIGTFCRIVWVRLGISLAAGIAILIASSSWIWALVIFAGTYFVTLGLMALSERNDD